ncbi:helix-turn-helix domain-containing protein [Thermodesulforhabdus norvegica]
MGMYLEGMNISSISRVLAISLATVYSWIKKALWALCDMAVP